MAVDVVAHGAPADVEESGCLAVGEVLGFDPCAQLCGTVGEGFAVIDKACVKARASHFGAQLGDLTAQLCQFRAEGVEALGEIAKGDGVAFDGGEDGRESGG